MLSKEQFDFLEHYNQGLALYKEKKWQEALGSFESALGVNSTDKPTMIYIDRCKHYLTEPPPADWDGVFTLETK